MAVVKTVTSSGIISAVGLGTFKGFVISNDHDTDEAQITIYDNASAASGTVIAKVVVGPDSTETLWLAQGGVNFTNGLYCGIAAGTISASIYWE